MSAIYNNGKLGIADQSIDWDGGTFLAVPVGSSFVVNQSHSNLGQIAGELGGGSERVTLTGTSLSINTGENKVQFLLNDPTFEDADFGDLYGIVIVQDGGSDAGRRLVSFHDGSGFPVTTNGSDVTIDFPGWAFRF